MSSCKLKFQSPTQNVKLKSQVPNNVYKNVLREATRFPLDHSMLFRYSFYGTKKRKNSTPIVRSFSHTPACLPYTGSCPTLVTPALPTYTMIRENSLLCKLIRIKIRIKTSSKVLSDSFIEGFWTASIITLSNFWIR